MVGPWWIKVGPRPPRQTPKAFLGGRMERPPAPPDGGPNTPLQPKNGGGVPPFSPQGAPDSPFGGTRGSAGGGPGPLHGRKTFGAPGGPPDRAGGPPGRWPKPPPRGEKKPRLRIHSGPGAGLSKPRQRGDQPIPARGRGKGPPKFFCPGGKNFGAGGWGGKFWPHRRGQGGPPFSPRGPPLRESGFGKSSRGTLWGGGPCFWGPVPRGPPGEPSGEARGAPPKPGPQKGWGVPGLKGGKKPQSPPGDLTPGGGPPVGEFPGEDNFFSMDGRGVPPGGGAGGDPF